MEKLHEMTGTGQLSPDWRLDLDFQHHSAKVNLCPVQLTRKEYDLLEFLVRNTGDVVKSQVLLGQVFGYAPEAHTRTLHVHIRRLRKKLGLGGGHCIETIFGVGYRYRPVHPARVEMA